MPDYRLTLVFEDDINGTTRRTFEGNFIDDASAETAAANFVADYQAVTSAGITRRELTKVTELANTPTAGSLVFNTASVTVNKSGGGKANVSIPAAAPAIMAGNSVDLTVTAFTDWLDNIGTGGGGWTISDGETADSAVSGKRVIVRSGSTNLPT